MLPARWVEIDGAVFDPELLQNGGQMNQVGVDQGSEHESAQDESGSDHAAVVHLSDHYGVVLKVMRTNTRGSVAWSKRSCRVTSSTAPVGTVESGV